METKDIAEGEIEYNVRRFRERFPDVPRDLIEQLALARLRTMHPSTDDEEYISRHELLALVGTAREMQDGDLQDEYC